MGQAFLDIQYTANLRADSVKQGTLQKGATKAQNGPTVGMRNGKPRYLLQACLDHLNAALHLDPDNLEVMPTTVSTYNFYKNHIKVFNQNHITKKKLYLSIMCQPKKRWFC